MLAALLHRRGKPHKILRRAVLHMHVDDFGSADRERARLVEHDRVQPVRQFERLDVFNQDAEFRGNTGSGHDRCRCGKSECTRAGDDKHRDRRDQCGARIAGREHPARKRDRGNGCYRGHENFADPVDQALHRAPCLPARFRRAE